MKKLITVCVVIVLFVSGYAKAGTWITLDKPGASSTEIHAVSGNTFVGTYEDGLGQHHGFLYNGTTWTTLDKPGASGETYVYGMSGSNVVGSYSNGPSHGFIYNQTSG